MVPRKLITLASAALALALMTSIAVAQDGAGELPDQFGEQVAERGAGAHEAEAEHHFPDTSHFNWFDFGYAGKDINGGELEPGEEPMSAPAIGLLINFGIVLILLFWKAGPPISRFVRKRHVTIKEALEEAARLRQEAADKLDEYNRRIADAEREVDELITSIRADAEEEKKRIIERAEKQAAALKKNAEDRIAAELARARYELEREIVAAAAAAAEKLLRAKATPADKQTLVDGFIADVKDAASGVEERV